MPSSSAHSLNAPQISNKADVDVAPVLARCDALYQTLVARDVAAHMMVHDLRTPLTTLSGLLHLMQMNFASELPEKAQEYLDYMSRATTQLVDLSDGVLDRMCPTQDAFYVERVDIRTALDCVLDELRPEIEAANATLDVSGSTWFIMADPVLLHLMLMNLIRHTLRGHAVSRPLEISLRLSREDGGDGTPNLQLRDTGIGFAPHHSKAIFLLEHKPPKGARGGDIGLATCKSICARHGWTINAQSDGVTGATFDVMFSAQMTAFKSDL